MLWIKSFHIIFVVSWFAGIFYLPRLFVYHAQNPGNETQEYFKVMERRLLVMMHIAGSLTLFFGIWLFWIGWDVYLTLGWMHVKLLAVVLLLGYHYWCGQLVIAFREGRNTHSEKWYRIFNEVPVLMLAVIVVMVKVKPF